MPVLDTCKFKEVAIILKALCAGQHFPHYNSMGKICVAQGLVTLQKLIRPGPNSNWSDIESPVLDICKFEEVAIKTQVSMGWTTFSPL